jgi:hypothetical protein
VVSEDVKNVNKMHIAGEAILAVSGSAAGGCEHCGANWKKTGYACINNDSAIWSLRSPAAWWQDSGGLCTALARAGQRRR